MVMMGGEGFVIAIANHFPIIYGRKFAQTIIYCRLSFLLSFLARTLPSLLTFSHFLCFSLYIYLTFSHFLSIPLLFLFVSFSLLLLPTIIFPLFTFFSQVLSVYQYLFYFLSDIFLSHTFFFLFLFLRSPFLILCHFLSLPPLSLNLLFLFNRPGNPNWRGNIRTVDLLVLTSSVKVVLIMLALFTCLQNNIF